MESRSLLEKRRALIIAVSEYNNPLQHLPFCKNDGEEMYEVLKSLGYQIPHNNKLVGQVKGNQIKDAIYDFFGDETINSQDTILFYYSGHGIPDIDGDVYLASSEINPKQPYRNGFSFSELTKMMNRSLSTRVVAILDCCYGGAAKVGKGNEDDAAKIGTFFQNFFQKNLHCLTKGKENVFYLQVKRHKRRMERRKEITAFLLFIY